jgi:hypothetical protein
MERKSSDMLSAAPVKKKGKARATVRYCISFMPCSFDSQWLRKASSSYTTSNLPTRNLSTPHYAATSAADPGASPNPSARENVREEPAEEPAEERQPSVEDSDELPFHSEWNTQTGSGLRESQQNAADKRRLQRRARDLAVQQARVCDSLTLYYSYLTEPSHSSPRERREDRRS